MTSKPRCQTGLPNDSSLSTVREGLSLHPSWQTALPRGSPAGSLPRDAWFRPACARGRACARRSQRCWRRRRGVRCRVSPAGRGRVERENDFWSCCSSVMRWLCVEAERDSLGSNWCVYSAKKRLIEKAGKHIHHNMSKWMTPFS